MTNPSKEHAEVVDWADLDIARLVSLESDKPNVFVSRFNEDNGAGRIFGGQILAQALAAVSRTVPAERPIHSLQLTFCNSGKPARPVRYAVQSLSDGVTTSVRGLRADQDDRLVCVGNASCRRLGKAFEHDDPVSRPVSGPELHVDAATLVEGDRLAFAGHPLEYIARKGAIELRLVDAPRRFLDPLTSGDDRRVHFWVRSPKPLPNDPIMHQCAVAYLTDYILAHVPPLQIMPYAATKSVGAASVNHALWFYRPLRADAWLLVEVSSAVAAAGRGLATAKVYDSQRRVAAVTTQECVYRTRASSDGH
jgi:acyl-CoA thioesterase-2